MTPLRADIKRILHHLALMAAGYSSGLKWNEESKLKADLMNRPDRWQGVDIAQVRLCCAENGMQAADIDTIVDLISKAVAGRRLVPQASYRTFAFRDGE